MKTSFQFSGGKLIFVIKGIPYYIQKSDRNFASVAKALKEGKTEDEILEIYKHGSNIVEYLASAKQTSVAYVNGQVLLNGKPLHNSITSRVATFAEAGLPIEYLLKFIENIEQNPSFNSRNQLYQFLEHSDIVLTDDGCFIAYKAVRSNYYDKYSGTILNTVGEHVSMDRSKIDDSQTSHCSYGLHVGSILYAGPGGFYHQSGDRVMLVKVNPKDVVAVPNDHSCQKCRVCEYDVVGEVTEKLTAPLYTSDGKPYDYDHVDEYFDGFEYEEDDDYDDDDVYDYGDEDEEESESSWYDDDEEEEEDDDEPLDMPNAI